MRIRSFTTVVLRIIGLMSIIYGVMMLLFILLTISTMSGWVIENRATGSRVRMRIDRRGSSCKVLSGASTSAISDRSRARAAGAFRGELSVLSERRRSSTGAARDRGCWANAGS